MWLIGASGGVGSAVALGVAALRRHLVGLTGLVTALPPFERAGLVKPDTFVLGGHEIREEPLHEAILATHERAGLYDENTITTCEADLRAIQQNIVPGTLCGAGEIVRRLADRNDLPAEERPAKAIARLAADIVAFRERNRLDRVVVVHLASSEPPVDDVVVSASFENLQSMLAGADAPIVPTSALYALAAVEAGCAFLNFTPSPGICLQSIRERAERLGLPYMGNDGKTGETLIKSALAPMFAMRNLDVQTWSAHNILGNRDGAVLSDPMTRTSKLESKGKVVEQILGDAPTSHVSIEYTPSLDDWKVAWDFIHFQGFFNTKMSLQFTWQGSDSVLAAPLVLDLARLAARACECGEAGPLRYLSFFFKDPIGVDKHNLFEQWQMLLDHVNGWRREET